MGNSLYVGNLSYSATEEEIQSLFAPYGEVERVRIILDRDTGRSRGFGFVTMARAEDAARALDELNGRPFMNRALVVNEARPRPEPPGGRTPQRPRAGGRRRGSVEGAGR